MDPPDTHQMNINLNNWENSLRMDPHDPHQRNINWKNWVTTVSKVSMSSNDAANACAKTLLELKKSKIIKWRNI